MRGTGSALLYAENVSDTDGIDKVWATIMPPGCLGGSPDTPVTPPSVELAPAGNGRYEATYEGFTDNGTYTVVIYAVDTQGLPGIIEQTSVIRTKGDIDGDDRLTLADALIVLRTLAGTDTLIGSDADVSGDHLIGNEEAIFILRRLAEN